MPKRSVVWPYIIYGSMIWCSFAFPTLPVRQTVLMDQMSVERSYPLHPQEYGIGFDLTGSYGTAAISYANGSTFKIARIEAEPAYKALLAKWSLESSQHPAPPYRDIGEIFDDIPRQRRRRERKEQGLPASEDVDTLSVMLGALRDAFESFLGHPITSALAATPNLIALYKEDMGDAFEYIGLKSLDEPALDWAFFQEPAASAASYGIGLCLNYTDTDACTMEQNAMPFNELLAVLYTKDALWVEASTITSAYYSNSYTTTPPSADFSLGPKNIHDNPKEQFYWEAVNNTVYRAVFELLRFDRRPSVVFVFGEESRNERFRMVLEDSLRQIYGEVPKILDDDPTFRPAMGAAELAKRGGYLEW